jgi:hypothetical protein
MSRLAPEFPVNDVGTRGYEPTRYGPQGYEPSYERGWGSYLPSMSYPRRTNGFLLAGLLAVGVGALAWYYLGPDLRRYMKIRSM